MKGDFSRNTFDRSRHLSTVRMQQGRVQLDADWNEQMDILEHLGRAARIDLFGDSGTPANTEGFRIERSDDETPGWPAGSSNTLLINTGPMSRLEQSIQLPGRYYVDGILCEIEPDSARTDGATLITAQPDLPLEVLATDLAEAAAGQVYLIYLDVWERHLTALEDASLAEPALGGADSASRFRTVWHVRALDVTNEEQDLASFGVTWLPEGLMPSQAKMAAQAAPANDSGGDDPCIIPADSGYRGLENLLYRVEIHKLEALDPTGTRAWFKWSRNNASVAAKVTALSQPAGEGAGPYTSTFTLEGLSSEQLRELRAGQLLELTDADLLRAGLPGMLLTLSATPTGSQVTATWVEPSDGSYTLREGALLIPWDCDGLIPINAAKVSSFYSLGSEDTVGSEGVQIRFESEDGAKFRVGDYWQVPVRAAVAEDPGDSAAGQVMWPADTEGGEVVPRFVSPLGVQHHYCALARVPLEEVDTDTFQWGEPEDLRRRFPAVTDLVSLRYVSGDRQEGKGGEWLEQPIEVGLAYGPLAVSGQTVVLALVDEDEGGLLGADGGAPEAEDEGESWIEVTTDENGIARAYWKLGSNLATQQVRGYLPAGSSTGGAAPPMKGLPVVLTGLLRPGKAVQSFSRLADMLVGLQVGEIGLLNTYDAGSPLLREVWTFTDPDELDFTKAYVVRSDQSRVYYLFYGQTASGVTRSTYLRALNRETGTQEGVPSPFTAPGIHVGKGSTADAMRELALGAGFVYVIVSSSVGSTATETFTIKRYNTTTGANDSTFSVDLGEDSSVALFADGKRVYAIASSAYSDGLKVKAFEHASYLPSIPVAWSSAPPSTIHSMCTDGELIYMCGARAALSGGEGSPSANVYAANYSSGASFAWTFDCGGSPVYDIAGICCDSEFVYLTGSTSTGSENNTVVWALSKVTGQLIWNLAWKSMQSTTELCYGRAIACDDRYVYVVTQDFFGYDRFVIVLSKSGAVVRRSATSCASSIDADGDTILIAGGNEPPPGGTANLSRIQRLDIPCVGRAFVRVGPSQQYRSPLQKILLPHP